MNSELFEFYEWKGFDANFDIAKVKFDRCQTVLRELKNWLPIKKRREAVSSHSLLVAQFAELQGDSSRESGHVGSSVPGHPTETRSESKVQQL
eukprot:7428885-Heterocapsa_arctica.AAC.1